MSFDEVELPPNAKVLRVPESYRLPESSPERPGHTLYMSPSEDDPQGYFVVAVPYDAPEGKTHPKPPVPVYAAVRVTNRGSIFKRRVRVCVSDWVDIDGFPHDEAEELTSRVRASVTAYPPSRVA